LKTFGKKFILEKVGSVREENKKNHKDENKKFHKPKVKPKVLNTPYYLDGKTRTIRKKIVSDGARGKQLHNQSVQSDVYLNTEENSVELVKEKKSFAIEVDDRNPATPLFKDASFDSKLNSSKAKKSRAVRGQLYQPIYPKDPSLEIRPLRQSFENESPLSELKKVINLKPKDRPYTPQRILIEKIEGQYPHNTVGLPPGGINILTVNNNFNIVNGAGC